MSHNVLPVLHFHQPVGQLDDAIRRICEHSYGMLLDFISSRKIPFTLHISGPLLEWMAKNRPDLVERVRELVQTGKVELLGGTMYEAILPIIPEMDGLSQIALYKKAVKELFGITPNGFWLPERVWEPHLTSLLSRAGVRYVLLDDYHFRQAGIRDPRHSYVTEDSGKRLRVFPINEEIRYLMPWREPREAYSLLKRRAGDPSSLTVVFADAEKFGEWTEPEWARWWLEEFYSKVEADPELVVRKLGDYASEFPPRGLAYFPSAAYDKMVRWSRGHFRNFLARYPESNNMHKKMLYVREKIEVASNRGLEASKLEEAWQHLYRGQCNDAYWHGMFGGVYLPNLREAIYRNLIRAEAIADEKVLAGKAVIERDFDYDGRNELILETRELSAYVDPWEGGNVFELDWKEGTHNFADTLSQPWEAYHDKIGNPPIDWYRRTLFRDHIFRREDDAKSLYERKPFIDAGDFTVEPFEVVEKTDEPGVLLRRKGRNWSSNVTLVVEKKVRIAEGSLEVEYRLIGEERDSFFFCPEVDFALDPGTTPACSSESGEAELKELVRVEGRKFSFRGPSYGLEVELSEGASCYAGPLLVVAITERGRQELVEGTVFLPCFYVELPGERTLSIRARPKTA